MGLYCGLDVDDIHTKKDWKLGKKNRFFWGLEIENCIPTTSDEDKKLCLHSSSDTCGEFCRKR